MPVKADEEIATALFAKHLDQLWSGPLPDARGWSRTTIDPMHTLVGVTAVRSDSQRDPYYLLLGAEYYDRWPPTAQFVDPDTLRPAATDSRWWPVLQTNPPWGAIHANYRYLDGQNRPLICITLTAEYYQTQHNPPAHTVWRQGKHTVAATITRITEMLSQPYYGGPARS